ncbi:MAG: TonB-dependent receptor [Bacteroidetes bacterium GWF2_40_14]|nr:MAG: TonB-dependent receptor [Bacteroidetes bacterium GWF2_40_14]
MIFGVNVQNSAAQNANVLKGVVLDKASGEPVIGATIFFEELKKGSSTDMEGKYSVIGVPAGRYKIQVACMTYKTISVPDLIINAGSNQFDIVMEEAQNVLNEVVVSSVRRMSSEIAMVQATRTASVVMSGLSGRQISLSQDKSAAEVVKRIPGVSVINDRYIMVRGLASRYNNVWINNSAVPSTEADTRSFSFDILPSSQLENIMIVKSQSPEIPADFSGGFVKITTRSMPDKNEILFSYGMSANSQTHFNDHFYNTASPTDFMGFDNGVRSLRAVVPARVNNGNSTLVTDITKNGFRNDWSVKRQRPFFDQKGSFMINRTISMKDNAQFGLVGAINYSKSAQTYSDILNARFGVYNTVSDASEYIYKYTDNQYSLDAKVGAMLNLTYLKGNTKLEFRNLLNQIGKNRYTTREGWQNISARYNQEKQEYLYTSRTTYTGQFAGNHKLSETNLDWNISYSYAGLNQPDRRIINREENVIYGDRYFGQMGIDQNEITRDFVKLDEHIISPAINITIPAAISTDIKSEIKAGIYGEFRSRDYNNRQFFYRFNQYNLPENFVYSHVTDQILKDENLGSDKLYIYEDTDNRNSYKGQNMLGAAYLSYKLPLGRFNILAGARVEASRMKLISYDKIYEFTTSDKNYDQIDIFPSLNASYNINKKNLIRFAYGSSTNRQEFREVSSSVYYDFNLFSDVKGNKDLKNATIHNLDLRYEYYPSNEEYITMACFYKYFINPIEWTYLDAGGSYTYTFENAHAAKNFGLEIDMKKNLAFLGVKELTLGLNAALISSKVDFEQESLEKDRPMQGQSPYLVNASLFYDNPKYGISAGLLYNRIGKRIVGIGRVDTGSGASINNDVPDTYELPRDMIDLVVSKKIGKRLEVKASFKDILNQDVIFEQYPKYIDNDGVLQQRSQLSKKFKPGANFFLGLQISL